MSNGMKSPLDLFFKMGEKATGGDPEKQADFIYYMVWILFSAFLWMFFYNGYDLFFNKNLGAATWTLVGFAICVIQYFSLKGMYDMKQMKKGTIKKDDTPLESVDDMMKGFDDKKETKRRSNKTCSEQKN